jgi:hypothetical protein
MAVIAAAGAYREPTGGTAKSREDALRDYSPTKDSIYMYDESASGSLTRDGSD